MFDYLITRPMGFIINAIYSLVANYGLAIILFTVVIKLILLPLTVRSQKAMKKQQKIQPAIAKLQEKYANEPEQLQREMMKIYKENNISMTGGCLPLLIQMPILIGLYQVIRKPLTYLANVDWGNLADAANPVVQEITRLRDGFAGATRFASLTAEQIVSQAQIELSTWASKLGVEGSFLTNITDGVHPWTINFDFFGLDLANVPWDVVKGLGITTTWADLTIFIIPVLAVVFSVLSMKLSQAQSGQNQKKNDDSQAAQMSRTMNLMMPAMTAFFTVTLSAGLGLYWIISSVVQIIQQLAINYYFDKKGEEIVVTIPEKKQKHGKKRKK